MEKSYQFVCVLLVMAAASIPCVKAVDAPNLQSGSCKVQGNCNTGGSMLLQLNSETKTAVNWVLFFRQTAGFLYGTSEWSKNPDDPENDNYAILDMLESCRATDGKFTLKLSWPGTNLADQIWKQQSNPVTRTTNGVEGYEAINASHSANRWFGLERNGVQALLDGSDGGMWWYAVGATRTHGGGIPGTNVVVRKVELYADCVNPPERPTTTTTAPPVWSLVFRQTLPYLYNNNEWSKNPTEPTNSNYAILDRLESCRREGLFRFKLRWPGSGMDDQIWRQRNNPVNTTGVDGYEAITVPHTEYNWGGLEKGGDEALLDGSIGKKFWYSIGARQIFYHGIAGPSVVVPQVELFADCATPP